MTNTTIALWTLFWTILVLLVYKFVINPQLVLTPSVQHLSACPEHWSYDATTKLCSPTYDTPCGPFNPETVTTISQACGIATACGTNWSGMCL